MVRPTKPQTPSHDTIVKVVSHPICPNCASKFEFVRHIAIATESYPDVERNEMGSPILDKDGNPKLKTTISYQYIGIPRVMTTEDMEEDLKALTARRDPELEILKKAAIIKDQEIEKRKRKKDGEQEPEKQEQAIPA